MDFMKTTSSKRCGVRRMFKINVKIKQNQMLMLQDVLTNLCNNYVQATPFRDWIERRSCRNAKSNKCFKLVAKEQRRSRGDRIYNCITTVNAECSAIIMNKVPEKLEDPGKFLIPCALQELDRTSALADSGASINLLPHSIYKQLGLGALTPTRMTLELANRSITHPMGIAEDVVVRVDGFTFLADFVVVNFVPDPRVPIILGRPFLRTAKALIDLYEETLTLRVGKEELVYYADKSEKNKDKHFVHAISVIDFSKNDPFSGSTTTHSDDPSPSSSTVKTSDNLEKFTDELTPLNSLPPGDDVSIFQKDSQKGNFQVHSNPLFEFDDNFKSSTINPLFDEMEEDVEIENSNEPELLQTPLSNKGECFDPGDDIDEINAFLAIEISMDYEKDTTHNFSSEVIFDHDTSISFSPRSDPLHHEFVREAITLPSRNDREFEEYLSLMTVLCEISTSRSQEDVHANQSSIIESLPVSPIPVEDSDPVQEEIDIFLVPDDLIPPGVENDDSEDEDNELPNLDHQDNPSSPRPPPEPPDVEKCFKPEAGILITKVFKGVSKPHDFMADILPTLPTLVSDLTFILFLSSFLSFGSEDTIFDPGIITFPFSYLEPVAFSMKVSCSNLRTLHFLKFSENSFEVLKLLENNVEVLKILENKLESMKILENKLESMKILENKLESLKLQENQPVDGLPLDHVLRLTANEGDWDCQRVKWMSDVSGISLLEAHGRIARLYLKDDDAVNAKAFINKVSFLVNTTVVTRAGQKNSENLLVFQVRVLKTLKGSTQTLKSVSSFGEDKGFLCSVTGQKKVQQIVQQEKIVRWKHLISVTAAVCICNMLKASNSGRCGETLWMEIGKAKHGSTRGGGIERVLWGVLKTNCLITFVGRSSMEMINRAIE
ncbi:reverse transcriptase domain-containing protein [Tanacetum coccineum]